MGRKQACGVLESGAWKIGARHDAGFVRDNACGCQSMLIGEFSMPSNMQQTVPFDRQLRRIRLTMLVGKNLLLHDSLPSPTLEGDAQRGAQHAMTDVGDMSDM